MFRDDKSIEQILSEVGAAERSHSAPDPCPGVTELHGLLEGTSPRRERAALREHIARCPDCSELTQAFLTDDYVPEEQVRLEPALMKSLERIPARLGPQGRRDARTSAEPTDRLRTWLGSFRLRPLYGAGFAALAVLVMVFVYWPSPLEVHEAYYAEEEHLTRSTSPRPLSDGAVLSSGDRFYLTVEPTARSFVYVVAYDSQGRLVQLFPQPELGPTNPLSPGRVHSIPAEMAWTLDHHPGTETVFLLASLQAAGELDGLMAELEGLADSRPHDEAEARMKAHLSERFDAIKVLSFEHR